MCVKMSLYAGQVPLPWMGISLLLQHWMWSDCVSDNVFVDHLGEKRGSYTTVPSQCCWKGSGFVSFEIDIRRELQSCENTHLFLKCLCIVCVVHMNRIATCPRLIRTSSGHVLAVCYVKNWHLHLPSVWVYEMLHARSCFTTCGTFWVCIDVDLLEILL